MKRQSKTRNLKPKRIEPYPILEQLSTEIEISIVHVNARRKLNCNMQNSDGLRHL